MKVFRSVKRIVALSATGIFLWGCGGGHATCDAYAHYKFEQEKQELNNEIIEDTHHENGTL